jgi:hypothetical protein
LIFVTDIAFSFLFGRYTILHATNSRFFLKSQKLKYVKDNSQ